VEKRTAREQLLKYTQTNASGFAPKTISTLSQMKRIFPSLIAGGSLCVQCQQPVGAMRNH
jgi:hypothetical protein